MIEEKIIVGEGTQYPLQGCLALPSQATEPVPAVVFVHGSGSSNMDEKVGKLTPFRDLAHGLAAHGIASIRYDKRTFAHAIKLLRDKSLTVTVKEETIEDAILATELLRKDPRIDPHKVFIIGHSMGAMLAPRIEAEGGNYRGLILLAGTPRRLEEVLIEQNNKALDEMKGLLRRLVEKQIKKLNGAFDGLYEMSDEEAKAKKMGGGVTLYYFKEMGDPPVEFYLRSLTKPILVMQGEEDFQVRADTDFRLYKEILADHPDASCILYEKLNHAFVPSVYGSISKAKQEYGIEQHIGENVIADIARWILRVSET